MPWIVFIHIKFGQLQVFLLSHKSRFASLSRAFHRWNAVVCNQRWQQKATEYENDVVRPQNDLYRGGERVFISNNFN